MNEAVKRDLGDSAFDFVRAVWPVIGGWCGGGEIVPTEASDDPSMTELFDRHAGIDAWQVVGSRSAMRGIASRVQYAPHTYASFTIRASRSTGAETELEKRLAAMQDRTAGWLFPSITAQAYLSERRTGVVLGAAVVYTAELYRFILDGREGVEYERRTTASDGNEFVAVYWSDLRDAGLKIRTLGESLLRSRRPPADQLTFGEAA